MLLSHDIYAHIKCISYIMCKLYVYTLMGNRHKLDTARGSLSEMTIGYTLYINSLSALSPPLFTSNTHLITHMKKDTFSLS